jgi:F420-dependent oxidoreductase-like protein
MRFGLFTSLTNASWADVLALWRHTAATGWDAACVTDHFMPNTADRLGDTLECWSTLASLAAVIPRMRLGTIVAGNTYRHPALLAKMAVNVDIVSGGRLMCGIGAGWQENEHQAYGIPFGTLGERLGRLDEACQILKALWTRPKTTFDGRYYQLEDAPCMPKSVQQPHPELIVGGGGEKVTLRIAARHADHTNIWGGPDVHARKRQILDEHCLVADRDPKTLLRSANMLLLITDRQAEIDDLKGQLMRRLGRDEPTALDTLLAGSVGQIQDKVGRLRETGAEMLFLPTFFMPGDPRPQLDRFMAEVAPAVR